MPARHEDFYDRAEAGIDDGWSDDGEADDDDEREEGSPQQTAPRFPELEQSIKDTATPRLSKRDPTK